MGGMSMVNPVTCIYIFFFYFFEALNDAFEVEFFSGPIFFFYTLSKTLIANRAIQLRFFYVVTL